MLRPLCVYSLIFKSLTLIFFFNSFMIASEQIFSTLSDL